MYNIHVMDIIFANSKLEKLFSSEKELLRKYGPENGKLIMKRITFLMGVNNLGEVPHTPPFGRHQLVNDRKGQFAIYVKHPQRLLFMPNHNPLPKNEDGGLDLKQVTSINIIGVEDYH